MARVKERHAEVSKATVYNTLNLFFEKKLIREVIVDPTKVFYDSSTSPHHPELRSSSLRSEPIFLPLAAVIYNSGIVARPT